MGLAALAVLVASAAWAQAPAPAAFKVISPIFGQLVTFSMPTNFVAAFENTNGPNYIREAVLKGETADHWTQMITVTGAKGAVGNPKATPESFAGSIVGGFKSACPDTFAAKGFGPDQIRRSGRLCRRRQLRQRWSRQAQRNSAHRRRERPGRLLHAAVGRARIHGRQGRHRRSEVAGPAAPVTADPLLSNRAGRACAVPELRRQRLAARPC